MIGCGLIFSVACGLIRGVNINDMDTDMRPPFNKVAADRLRRHAKRLGVELRRSRARNIHHDDLGGFQLVDRQGVVLAGKGFDLDLATVEHELRNIEQKLAAERRS